MYEAHYHKCRICKFTGHRFQVHLKVHNLTLHQYEEQFGFIPTIERLIARTTRVNDCLEYTGAIATTGYGQVTFAGKKLPASRVMYMATHKVLLRKDQIVCHSCDNRKCINPDHLWLGSQRENVRDMYSKRRDRMFLKVDRSMGDDIRRAVAAGESQADMCRKYHLSPATVSMVMSGQRGTRDSLGRRL